MKKKNLILVLTICALTVICLSVAPAFAINTKDRSGTQAVSTGNLQDQAAADQIAPLTYGMTSTIILQIPAAAFHPADPGTQVVENMNGYVSTTGGTRLFAPVNLPCGAQIRWLDLYYQDTDATHDAEARLFEFTGTGSPFISEIADVTSAGNAGFGYSSYMLNPMVTVDNDNQYMVYVYLVDGTSLRFKGVNIWYRLQMSPAPASATFSDVPTTHPFFQEIEALAASDITTGYGDGTFRPNNYVTRAAMAAYLARALGLHWSY